MRAVKQAPGRVAAEFAVAGNTPGETLSRALAGFFPRVSGAPFARHFLPHQTPIPSRLFPPIALAHPSGSAPDDRQEEGSTDPASGSAAGRSSSPDAFTFTLVAVPVYNDDSRGVDGHSPAGAWEGRDGDEDGTNPPERGGDSGEGASPRPDAEVPPTCGMIVTRGDDGDDAPVPDGDAVASDDGARRAEVVAAAAAELESDLDVIRRFQRLAAERRAEKEERDQLLWTRARKERHARERAAAKERMERVMFGLDAKGLNEDGVTFDIPENLDDLDGIGSFLQSMHAADREYPYRIPEGW